jgi:hypothetical protein
MNLKTWQIGMAMALAVGATLQMEVAQASKTETILKADNAAKFSSVTTNVQKEMLPGGRFEFVESNERGTVNARLADMQALFDKHGVVAQMDMQTKVQLFNDQEAVNAILTRRDDDRLVCAHDAPLGTHIQRTTCQTYGEIERQRRRDVDDMATLKQVPDYYRTHCPGCPPAVLGQRPGPVH